MNEYVRCENRDNVFYKITRYPNGGYVVHNDIQLPSADDGAVVGTFVEYDSGHNHITGEYYNEVFVEFF